MKLLNKFLLTLLCAATISSCSAMTSEQQEQVNMKLLDSIWKGYLPGVQQAIAAGADIHAMYDDPLRCAAEKGHWAVVQCLIRHGANIHGENDYALRMAAKKGHLAVIQYLVEQGADIHAENDYALRWAAHNGHWAVVQYLVEQGADIHAYNDYALRTATCDRRLPVAVYLVRQGADRSVLSQDQLNLLNQYICSELQTALATNNWHRVEELLSAILVEELSADLQDLVRKLLVPAVQKKLNSACLVMPITPIASRTLSFIIGPHTRAAFSHLVKEDTVVGPNMASE